MGKHKKKSKKHREKKSKHKSKKKHYSSCSSSSSEDEWIEKDSAKDNKAKNAEVLEVADKLDSKRDDWMNITSLPGLFSQKDERIQNKEKERKEKEASKYDPKTSVRELNPYWREGGDGLPSTLKTSKFIKPNEDNVDYKKFSGIKGRTSNWRKKTSQTDENKRYHSTEQTDNKYSCRITEHATSSKTSDIIYESIDSDDLSVTKEVAQSAQDGVSEYLTDKEMNDIAAKIVKAEILGNSDRVTELKEKLEKARLFRSTQPKPPEDEEVLLTRTDSKGFSKPLNVPAEDPYNNKRKKQALNTHDSGKRQKYYPDDGKYSLQNMFENEKFGTTDQQEKEFMRAASKLSKSDDLDDMFMDNIRRKDSDEKMSRKDRDVAIREHQKISQSLDNCQRCVQSTSMLKHLMISLGETIFLSLPQYEPLTNGHCLIIPVRHVTCTTQLDENEWVEIIEFRKCLTNMFKAENKTVIFYETAINLNHYPHMVIHCVPMPEEQGDLAPIYFKKAIDECEMEWSTNKKLINMAGKDVRRSVPKGLPYFWVSFGMKEGFAHVIEEQKYFPKFFAEEIIGGILDLHHSKWRKSSAQKFETQKLRVVDFSKNWLKYDCTNKK